MTFLNVPLLLFWQRVLETVLRKLQTLAILATWKMVCYLPCFQTNLQKPTILDFELTASKKLSTRFHLWQYLVRVHFHGKLRFFFQTVLKKNILKLMNYSSLSHIARIVIDSRYWYIFWISSFTISTFLSNPGRQNLSRISHKLTFYL